MEFDKRHDIWVEKYRPKRIRDLILPEKYLKKFEEYAKNPTNILMVSLNPGTGKTSTLNAIIKETGTESLFINASLENGIDTLRGKISQFASTESLNGKPKIVVLDEADALTTNVQSGLRGALEEFSLNCRFIITCNYITNIIPPIVNRFEVIDFDQIFSSEIKEIIPRINERLQFILNTEGVKYEPQDLINVIKNYYPSIRGMINELQKSVFDNKLDLRIQKDSDFSHIIELIRKRNFEELMKAVYSLTNADRFYEFIFKNLNNLDIQVQNRPKVIVIVAKYQYQNAFVRDKNLNLGACLVELANLI